MWDDDPGRGTNDPIRDIDLVIPFNETTAINVWTVKRFTLSDGAYLEIQFQIETCNRYFGGSGCSFCIGNYYTSSCDIYCQPVLGNYTCNTSGNKVCADHKTGENCDMCQKEWSGEKCEECAENYFPEKVCNLTCTAVKGRYTCSDLGEIVCNENWKGAECDNCADHRSGETCEQCSEGWGGNKCQECAQDYYPEGLCNVTCIEEKNKFTCKEDGLKACSKNWRGEECDNCSGGYFGEFCVVFCEDTESYNCSSTGEIICLDNTTIAENNCKNFSKLSNKSKIIIGLTISISVLAVILLVGIILMRKKNKTKYTKPEKTTGVSKSGQSSTDLNASSKEMTYATLNHNSRDWKSTENEGFQNNAFTEADTTYATLNRELEHSIEDNNEQSNYTHLVVQKTRKTHIKKGKENVNQGVPQTENFKEDDTYADISIVVNKLGPNIGSEKKFDQLESHGLDPSSEGEEDAYSHPTKSNTAIKDCCQEELKREETNADHILGPKEKENPDEAADDNEEECMYADVSFVGKRKEFGMQEDRINEKEGSAVYFTMGEETLGMNIPNKYL